MNKSPLLTGLGGFALGCLTVFLYQKSDSPKASPVAAVVHSERAQESSGKTAIAEPAIVSKNSGAPEVKVTTSSTEANSKVQEVMKGLRESMQKRNDERFKARVDERLASLKANLGLSDEQLEKMRPLVEKMLTERGREVVLSGGDGSISIDAMQEKFKELGGEKAAAEAALVAALTPVQRAAYETWKMQESANKIEVRVNRELANLQSQLSLSPEQKDLAFAAFSKLAGESPSTENPLGFLEARKAKLEALKPILTPEQMSVYEKTSGNVMDFGDGEGAVVEIENGGGTIFSRVLSIGADAVATDPPKVEQK